MWTATSYSIYTIYGGGLYWSAQAIVGTSRQRIATHGRLSRPGSAKIGIQKAVYTLAKNSVKIFKKCNIL